MTIPRRSLGPLRGLIECRWEGPDAAGLCRLATTSGGSKEPERSHRPGSLCDLPRVHPGGRGGGVLVRADRLETVRRDLVGGLERAGRFLGAAAEDDRL